MRSEWIDSVEVRVDEAWRHDQAAGIDGLFSGYPGLGDDRDPAVSDTHIGYPVVHRLRVHHPAAVDDQVVLLGVGERGRREADRHDGQ